MNFMKKHGAIVCFLLASLILLGLFHKIVFNANQVSFASGGDGMKSTFGTVYHIKHDSTYWHTKAMNYPFGESVFFTGNQVVLTNTLKLLKAVGWDLSDYALGISNILILLSFALAALFIYLVFMELGVVYWMAILASLLIMILSNQWERLGGHYNLAYAYLIPVILYLLLRFYRKPSYGLSVIFGVLVILFSAKQLYIAAFILVLWVPFWIFVFFQDRERFGKPLFIISHVLIQFFIPFILFNLFSGMQDPGLDRTAFPWGFYPSRIRLEAVFLPVSLPHGQFLDIKGVFRSSAYVGLLGAVVAVVILFSSVRKLIRKKGFLALKVSDNPAWNILFWSGVISLFIAMGWPFSSGWERLLNYSGPFRQLRAIGRFVFPFYYIMTITSFLYLWRWHQKSGLRIRHLLLALFLLFAGFESMMHIRTCPKRYNNPISWHSELYNSSEQNQWYEKYNSADYQAIIPLPYFHIGSENYWHGDRTPVIADAYAASLGTGLPLTAVMLSRTSIKQTLMNLDLILEPYHNYPILEEFPDQKPLLILRHKKGGLSEHEHDLISKAELLTENDHLKIYHLTLDSIPGLISDRQKELSQLAEKQEADPQSMEGDRMDLILRESPGVLYEDFESEPNGVYSSEFSKAQTLFEGVVPDTGKYLVSFWFEGADRDLWPRTVFWNELYSEDGKKYDYIYTDFFRKMVLRDGSWGLVEYPVHVKEAGSRLKITMENKVITSGEMIIDQVLVRPIHQTHVAWSKGQTWVNNRALIPDP